MVSFFLAKKLKDEILTKGIKDYILYDIKKKWEGECRIYEEKNGCENSSKQ